MGKPDAPKPPDPKETAAAATGTNIGTAIANNTMGLVDQTTPYGSLKYSVDGYKPYTDPYTGQTYWIPEYSSSMTYSPEQQAILDARQSAQLGMANVAGDLVGGLSGAPTADQISAELYDLGAQRLDPRFEQEQAALDAKLANQGIVPGSEAYNREMELLAQSKNDAYNQLILNGQQTALQQVNNPYNQISSLLSGTQMANPMVTPYSPQSAATTDVAGIINNNYNQQMQGYNAEMSSYNNLMGGLFGAAAQVAPLFI